MEECDVCYLQKTDFYTCIMCRNHHCMDCNQSIRQTNFWRCPFCRYDLLTMDELYELMDDILDEMDDILDEKLCIKTDGYPI